MLDEIIKDCGLKAEYGREADLDLLRAGKYDAVVCATGTVQNPDGTTKEIELRAERPLTDAELAAHLNETLESEDE